MGQAGNSLEKAIGAAGLKSRVLLVGFKTYSTLPVFYGLAEGFVHVSLAEQWGLVINEAAASGLPLVLSKTCGAAAELLEPGVNGLLVEPTDVEDIAQAMHRLMIATDVERDAMGRQSRRLVANWGPERFAEGLRQAAQAALTRPPRQLAVWDRTLLRALSRRVNSNVS